MPATKKTDCLSSYLQSFVAPLARRKQTEGIAWLRRRECSSLVSAPVLCEDDPVSFLSLSSSSVNSTLNSAPPTPPVSAQRAHAPVHRHCLSPRAKYLPAKVHRDMPAGIFPGKRLSKHTQTVGTCQSKWLRLFFTKPDTVHPLWSFKTRHKQQQGAGGFFGLVAIEPIVLPPSFLPRIPPHNAMKSKLPFSTRQTGVAYGDKGTDLTGRRMHESWEKITKQNRPAKRPSKAPATAPSLVILFSHGCVLPDIR